MNLRGYDLSQSANGLDIASRVEAVVFDRRPKDLALTAPTALALQP